MNHNLTKRQCQVAILMARGNNSKDISRIFKNSPRTNDKHMSAVRQKTGCFTNNSIARWAIEAKLLTVEQWLSPDLPKDWAC